VLSAIENREGGRAEAIMREHSRLAQRNLSQAMRSPDLQGAVHRPFDSPQTLKYRAAPP
jgi:GntR family transcriptional regulator of vanillate catabolism